MLRGQNIVVFDLEIKNIIGENGVTWDTKEKMGISVGCLFDFKTLEYQVYCDDNLSELSERLNSSDLVVGFNIINFDLPLLNVTPENKVPLKPNLRTYDLLYWSRVAVGWDPDDPRSRFPSGLKLDDHLLGTFGPGFMKTSNGEEAPKMYQDRQIGRLVSYCLADVNRESKLFRHVFDGKPVSTKTHGTHQLKHPLDVLEMS